MVKSSRIRSGIIFTFRKFDMHIYIFIFPIIGYKIILFCKDKILFIGLRIINLLFEILISNLFLDNRIFKNFIWLRCSKQISWSNNRIGFLHVLRNLIINIFQFKHAKLRNCGLGPRNLEILFFHRIFIIFFIKIIEFF